ncbi:ElaA protein [Nocardioides albertanoniae]|uniref:ElaA protein n=1 Tax=Nocardioides albertanoniae TaxID=1175486 RepID=A0A543A206_9ACTN|nr:GNAT family N-acetyltransferase [Nocardioides albertanoniae]TQL66570.1 ElaA protein [Nocardioides albertanoniae]
MTSVNISSFDDLSPKTAYALWQLRQEIFIVEQDCPYPDLDGRDHEPGTLHVVLSDGDRVAGTARILDDGDVWRIGRVVLAPAYRGKGLSDVMMTAAVEATSDRAVVLDAQAPLAGWYATFGFVKDGEEFLEDGIPHIPMRLTR